MIQMVLVMQYRHYKLFRFVSLENDGSDMCSFNSIIHFWFGLKLDPNENQLVTD